jgi:SAM-dependent methyltransferase
LKLRFSADNPFVANRDWKWAYGYEFISDGDRVLDYGCFDGTFIRQLGAARKSVRATGVDKNKDIVDASKSVNIIHIKDKLPFDAEAFDVVTIFEVLEHVHDQAFLLAELHRVLKPGGRIIISVPQQYLFSFLDHGNWKYRFPKIHKFWYLRRHSLEQYEYRYVNNPSGLIGDVDKEKAWHQHFKKEELFALLNAASLSVVDVDGAGACGDLLNLLTFAGLGFLFPPQFRRWEDLSFENRHLFCVGEKDGAGGPRVSPE